MFESIVIRRNQPDGKIDAGLLAETLLYYSSVHLVFTGGTLPALLRTIGPDALLRLLEEGRVKGTFYADNLGTVTNTVNGIQFHNFTAFSITREASGANVRPRDWAARQVELALGKSPASKSFTKRFLAEVPIRYFEAPGHNTGLSSAAKEDVRDNHYVHDAVELVLRDAVPAYKLPSGWYFKLVTMQDGNFVVDTNLDFTAINAEYHKVVSPKINTITYAWVLTKILDARGDIQVAGDYMAELITDPASSAIVKRRVSNLFRRRDVSSGQIEAFQEAVFEDAASVREAINSGERSFDEFLHVLAKGDRFKDWLRSQNPDQSLITEYHNALNKETWFNSLPSKIARFSLFALSGAAMEALLPHGIGSATTAALTATDQFLLERLGQGWKPSQFIEGPLKKFISSE